MTCPLEASAVEGPRNCQGAIKSSHGGEVHAGKASVASHSALWPDLLVCLLQLSVSAHNAGLNRWRWAPVGAQRQRVTSFGPRGRGRPSPVRAQRQRVTLDRFDPSFLASSRGFQCFGSGPGCCGVCQDLPRHWRQLRESCKLAQGRGLGSGESSRQCSHGGTLAALDRSQSGVFL